MVNQLESIIVCAILFQHSYTQFGRVHFMSTLDVSNMYQAIYIVLQCRCRGLEMQYTARACCTNFSL